MKILLIASLFAPYRRGGAEVVAETAAKELLRAGHEVTVLTTRQFSGIKSLQAREDTSNPLPGGRVLRFFPLNIFSFIDINKHSAAARFFWHGLDMLNIHAYFVVRKLLHSGEFDLVVTHNLKGIGYTTATAIRCFAQTVWVHTIHDLGVLFPRGLLHFGREQSFENTGAIVRLYGAINRWLFGSPNLVVSRSQFFLDYYASHGFFKHAAMKRLTHDVAPRAVVLAKRPQGIYKFIFVGQLEEYKGVRVLLAAWKQCRARSLHGELHIVGDGTLYADVVRAASGDPTVIFHGEAFSNTKKLSELLPSMHAAVIPSLVYENTALTVIEALGAGLPVIASNIGGIREAIEPGVSGILVAPGDSGALSCAMEAITMVDWESYSCAAQAAAAHYDASAYCTELFSLLDDSQNGQKQVS